MEADGLMTRLESVYATGGALGALDAAAAQLATGLTPFSGAPVRLAFPAALLAQTLARPD